MRGIFVPSRSRTMCHGSPMVMPSALASFERAITQPSLLDKTTSGTPRSSGRNTRSNASSTACQRRSDADPYVAAASQIMDHYSTRIANRMRDDEVAALGRRRNIIESELLLAAVKAERKLIFSMAQRKEIGCETASKLIRELDLAEARYQA